MKLIVFIAASLLASCLSGCSNTDDPVQTYLSVRGKQIVSPGGNEVFLRGFQGLSAYPVPDNYYLEAVFDQGMDSFLLDDIAQDIYHYSMTDFDIQEIKSTGANVIRLWTRVYEIKRGPGVYSDTAMDLIEDAVNRFGENGIYTVLVMAGAGENNYEPQQPYLDRGINLWDPQSSARDDVMDAWGALSQRFAHNRYIAGYDIMNEPMPPSAEELHDFYNDAIETIRSADKHHILILSVAQGNRDTFQIGGEYDDDNIMVTFHFYEPHNFTLEPDIPDQTYPGVYNGTYWDKTMIDQAFSYAVNLSQLKDKPIYIGEFGAGGERDGNGGLEWTADVLDTMNHYDLHYTYHNYRHSTHLGYFTKSPEAEAQIKEMLNALVAGTLKYEDITETQKQNMFMTEYSCTKRSGIKELLTEAFLSGR